MRRTSRIHAVGWLLNFRWWALLLAVGVAGLLAAPAPAADAAGSSREPLAASASAVAVAAVSSASAPPSTAFFSQRPLSAPLSLGPEVLSPQERAFVSALPEVRVAIPLPAARPYEVVGDDGAVSGIHPDMLGYLARAFGLRVRPVLFPSWTAALLALERRDADLMISIGYTTDRARYLEYTLGVTPLPGALFTRSPAAGGKPGAASENDLARGRFALERNFLADDYVRRQYPQAQILTVETTGDALRAVAEGRADFYLGSLLAAIDWLARQPVGGIEINRLLDYGGGHYHFAVRKDWAPLAVVLNKGISSLRANGLSGPGGRPEWRAVAASLPHGMPLPAPLKLSSRELDVLIQRPVWRVGAVRGLPLLNNLEPNGVHSGIAAEMTEQVGRRLGVGIQIVGFDTVGLMLDALRRGEIDLIPFLTRTAEREREFAYSLPYVEMPYVIVARNDAPMYWGLDSLRGRRLALAAQHPLRPTLVKQYPDIGIVEVADGNEAMTAVARGRADAAVEVKLFANLRINGDGGELLRTVSVVDEVPAQFHFATTRANRSLLELVDRAIQDVPGGELQRMRRRWVAVDLDPPLPWRRWAPVLVTAAAALLVLAGVTAWWLRRLSREVAERRRFESRLRDIGATLPCVAFRHVFAPGSDEPGGSWVSSRAHTLLGLDPQPGQTTVAALAPRLESEDATAFVDEERSCREGSQPFRRTVVWRHPDGTRRWLTCEAVRSAADNGWHAWTGYIVDISAERELQAQLVSAAQTRNLILASASHELRAPAHTLALALQALPAQGLGEKEDAALRIARDAVDTLSQLLGDVLDAARFDGAPLRQRPQDFDLHELLHKLAESAAVSARAKKLGFVSHVDAQLPRRVHMDPLRLRQVAVNLLSNAFKYTPSGRVEMVALRRDDPLCGPQLALSVADTGPGIPPDLRARLFTPFVTGSGGTGATHATPDEGSTGLGLTICRQLAADMGGQLELHSEPGQGTRVTLLLPLREVAAPTDAPRRRGVLLVVDDDTTSRLLMGHLLTSRGFTVEETESAEQALERCAQGGVAAVVTDLEMPGMGGLGLLRELRRRAEGGGERPALVVCSGDSAGHAGAHDTQGLADARLVKPVDLPLLLQTLAALGVQPGG